MGPKTRPAQRNDEADRLRRQVEKLKRDLEQAGERIAEQQEEIRKLEKELAEARRNSTNSSKPPSSDGLAGPQRVRGRKPGVKCKRRAGGQIGHAGHYRKPVEAAKVSQTIEVLPKQCSRCGHGFAAGTTSAQVIGEPHRHQVVDLPPIEAWITEYQCIKLECPCCGQATRAALPDEARDQMGPRLTALVAYLTVVCRMPRRVVQRLLEQAMGITISLGSTQKCWEQMSEAVEGPCDELESKLDSEPVLNVDETGWRQSGEKRWIWALVAQGFVFYTVAANRSSEVLIHLLGVVFRGVLCSDRAAAYLKYHKGKAQFCWAHLKRNLLGILDFAKTTEAERFCRDALALHARLFRLWHRFRGDNAHRPELIRKSIPLQKKFFELADRHVNSDDAEVCNMARALFFHCDRLFTFLEEPGVEPTNNSAERALRIAVQWRKVSFGNRSANGELATARLLTATQTCKIQQRSALDYLTEALRCHRRGLSAPSLLLQQK